MADDAEKTRRLRSGHACEKCRKRKSKCDASRPSCFNCQVRGISCDYIALEDGHPAKHRKSQAVDTSVLVDGLQNDEVADSPDRHQPDLLDATWTHSPIIVGSTSAVDKLGERAARDPDNATLEQSRAQDTEASHQTLASNILPPQRITAPANYFGHSSTFAFVPVDQDDGSEDEADQEKPTHERWQFVSVTDGSTNDYDSPPGATKLESFFDLPDRRLADNLVDAYFSRIHKVYLFLHEGTFRTEYEMIWGETPSRRYSRLAWFGLLNIVFAHGAEICDTLPEVAIHVSAADFMARARRIILSHVFKSSALETVQSLLLMCYYLQSTVELNECWVLVGLMIRTAMSLGLYLNPVSPKFTSVTREVRKRVWAEDIRVDIPLDVDDQYISDNSIVPRQPIGLPSSTSLFISTIKLSHVIHSMLTKVYNGELSTNEDHMDGSTQVPTLISRSILTNAVLLDSELQSWWDNAPRHLTHDTEGKSGGIVFQRQRLTMKIRFHHVRLILHRRAFLAFLRQDYGSDPIQSIALASARICIDCARQTVSLITRVDPWQQMTSRSYSAQYVFVSMCILCTLNKAKGALRDLLNENAVNGQDDEIREQGIRFLESAARTSQLATRYVAVLKRLFEHPADESHDGGIQQACSAALVSRDVQLGEFQIPTTILEDPYMFESGANHSGNTLELNFTEYDQALYNMGIPVGGAHPFLETNWWGASW